MVRLLVFLSLCSFAFALECFYCDPTATGKCVDPVHPNEKKTNCDDIFKNKDENSDHVRIITQCYQYHLANVSDKDVGVYRGCVRRIRYSENKLLLSLSFSNLCEFWEDNPFEFGRGFENATISQCEVCDEDLCNKKAINGVAHL